MKKMKKMLFTILILAFLLNISGTFLASASDGGDAEFEFVLTPAEIDKFIADAENPDINWNRGSQGHGYIRPSYQGGTSVYTKAPDGGITVSNRDEYWHALDIRHEWMEADYTYEIEVDFVSDEPTIFIISNIPGVEAYGTEILAISQDVSTSATLKYEMSNENRTDGQRGVRLIAQNADIDFTVAAIRIYEGEIFIFPWWTVQVGLGALALAFALYLIIRSIKDEKFKQKLPDRTFIVCNGIFMCFVVIIMLYPFLNILAISFNNAQDSIRGNIYVWPRIFTLDNYEQVFKNPRLITAFRNSVLRTVFSTVGGLFVCSMAAYVLARKEFMWNKFVTVFFLMTMYVSAGLIPTLFLFRDLGLINHFNVYWVPGLFGAFNVIVIRTYMQGLPDSLVEAGRLDGAGEFRIFAQIILPICKPVLATVGLWIAVGNWNDWFTSFVFAPFDDSLTTLQYELMKELSNVMAMMGSQASEHLAAQGNIEDMVGLTPVAIRSAITIVATVPILCVYPFLQKYFVKGVHVGSVKG